MKLFNTMTRQKEEFTTITPEKVKMYVCGPTVYNYIHIGNARPICTFDVLRRYLEYKGYEVTFVQNFTDIDDKIINRANEENVDFMEISKRYIEEYQTDVRGLGIKPPTITPKATESIEEMLTMISSLIEQGYAYPQNGDVYFRSRKFEEYGKLSHQPLDDLGMGTRVEINEQKDDPLDFVLWKVAKEGEPSWTSPWGEGRPGWHIECSAMVNKHLGNTIDIHGGGQDLIFPHHENEIAQSECFHKGEVYANYWVHNAYLNVENKKMSKSEGNFFTVRDIAQKVGYEPIKYLMLQAHYRSPINFSEEIMDQCINSLERIHTSRNHLDFVIDSVDNSKTDGSTEFGKLLGSRKKQFETAMDDDLNTADGLSALFELVRDCNLYFAEPRPEGDVQKAIVLMDTICQIFGILQNREKETLDTEIETLIEERQQARKNKDFARSDEIRDQLKAQGIVLEDTPQGVKYHKI